MSSRTNTIKTLNKKENELLIKHKLNKECQEKNLKTFRQDIKNDPSLQEDDDYWNKFEKRSDDYLRIEIDIEYELKNIKKEKRAVRKKYKDEIKKYWEYDPPPAHHVDCINLYWMLYLGKNMIKDWVFEAKPLTTMKNKEFILQINNLLKKIKEKTEQYKCDKKTYNKRCSLVKNRLSERLKDEKRLELLEEYYGSNAAHVPNIIRLLKYADSKIQNYFERIETDKRIAERARISEEKTNKWSSECCWAKDEETYRKKRCGYLTYTTEDGKLVDHTHKLFKKECKGDKCCKMNHDFCTHCYRREQYIRKTFIIPNLLVGDHIRISGFKKYISSKPIIFDKFGDDEWDESFTKDVMDMMDNLESKMNV